MMVDMVDPARQTDVVGGYHALVATGALEKLDASLVGTQQRP